MKFICTTSSDDGKEEIFTFPRSIDHDAMAEVLNYIKNQTRGNWKRVRRSPISAGFVDSKGSCYGESITLNLTSREPEDTRLLAAQTL